MYTVIRFTGEPAFLTTLMKIGTAMNAIRPGVYSGLRKRGDGFACEVCADAEWGTHHAAILAFIDDFKEIIKQSTEAGSSVTVDIAVEPEELKTTRSIFVLHYEHSLLAALASCGAALEVSIY